MPRPRDRALLLGVVCLGASAFWLFDALPFQDLLAHAAAIAMRRRFPASAVLQANYKLGSEVGPYAAFLFLGDWLGRLVGPMRAVRVLATLPVVATPLALMFARRRLHGDRSLWAGFFGVALSFGFMTLLGLASYLFAMAALVVALVLWLELLREVDGGGRAAGREALFGAVALGVFFAHGYAFVLLGFLAALIAASPRRPAVAPTGGRLLRLRALLPGAALGAWSAVRGGPPPGSAGTFELVHGADYQTVLDKLSLLLTPTLMTRTGVDIAVGVSVWAVLLPGLRATLREPSGDTSHVADARASDPVDASSREHARSLGIAAVGAAALFVVLPHAAAWFGFIDGRVVPVFLFLVIACVRRPALGPRLVRALDFVAPAAALVVTVLVLGASARFQSEAAGYASVLAEVPDGATLLNLPLDPDSAVFTAHPFVHYDKLACLDRDVIPSDVWPDRATALYATPENPQARLPASYNSARLEGHVDWSSLRLEDWSHVVVRTRPGASEPRVPASLALLAHAGGFWLYKIVVPRAAPVD